MEAREAARQAIDEAFRDCHAGRNPSGGVNFVSGAFIEEMIARAFALAGYGGAPIGQARKNGARYRFGCGSSTVVGFWSTSQQAWVDEELGIPLHPQPTMFHELPQPPKSEAAMREFDEILAFARTCMDSAPSRMAKARAGAIQNMKKNPLHYCPECDAAERIGDDDPPVCGACRGSLEKLPPSKT